MSLLQATIAHVWGPKTRHPITEGDRLWLLRAVQSEGCDRRLVAQTLLNRFAWLGEQGDGRTLAELVRAYCQPLHNPRGLASQRETFDPETIAAVAEALQGPAPGFPAGAVHVAAANYVPQGSRQALVWSDGQCNSLYKIAGAKGSSGFLYRAKTVDGSAVPAWMWLGAAGYVLWRLFSA